MFPEIKMWFLRLGATGSWPGDQVLNARSFLGGDTWGQDDQVSLDLQETALKQPVFQAEDWLSKGSGDTGELERDGIRQELEIQSR